MDKINRLITIRNEAKTPAFYGKMDLLTENSFSSITGFLSFYTIRSFSRKLILENILIKGTLKEDGSINIYLGDKGFIPLYSEAKNNSKNRFVPGIRLIPGTLFFKGSFMDCFDFKDLTENISTFIVNGVMISFNKTKRASSIGKLNRIEDIIYLNSSITILSEDVELDNIKKYSKSNLGIDISMQFKRSIA